MNDIGQSSFATDVIQSGCFDPYSSMLSQLSSINSSFPVEDEDLVSQKDNKHQSPFLIGAFGVLRNAQTVRPGLLVNILTVLTNISNKPDLRESIREVPDWIDIIKKGITVQFEKNNTDVVQMLYLLVLSIIRSGSGQDDDLGSEDEQKEAKLLRIKTLNQQLVKETVSILKKDKSVGNKIVLTYALKFLATVAVEPEIVDSLNNSSTIQLIDYILSKRVGESIIVAFHTAILIIHLTQKDKFFKGIQESTIPQGLIKSIPNFLEYQQQLQQEQQSINNPTMQTVYMKILQTIIHSFELLVPKVVALNEKMINAILPILINFVIHEGDGEEIKDNKQIDEENKILAVLNDPEKFNSDADDIEEMVQKQAEYDKTYASLCETVLAEAKAKHQQNIKAGIYKANTPLPSVTYPPKQTPAKSTYPSFEQYTEIKDTIWIASQSTQSTFNDSISIFGYLIGGIQSQPDNEEKIKQISSTNSTNTSHTNIITSFLSILRIGIYKIKSTIQKQTQKPKYLDKRQKQTEEEIKIDNDFYSSVLVALAQLVISKAEVPPNETDNQDSNDNENKNIDLKYDLTTNKEVVDKLIPQLQYSAKAKDHALQGAIAFLLSVLLEGDDSKIENVAFTQNALEHVLASLHTNAETVRQFDEQDKHNELIQQQNLNLAKEAEGLLQLLSVLSSNANVINESRDKNAGGDLKALIEIYKQEDDNTDNNQQNNETKNSCELTRVSQSITKNAKSLSEKIPELKDYVPEEIEQPVEEEVKEEEESIENENEEQKDAKDQSQNPKENTQIPKENTQIPKDRSLPSTEKQQYIEEEQPPADEQKQDEQQYQEKFAITVIRVKDIAPIDWNEKSNPYVVMKFNQQEQKTKKVKDIQNADYNETFEFDIEQPPKESTSSTEKNVSTEDNTENE
ncbi:MAG: hypothetical protein EZS28_027843, partial [Streblomastix strix]